DPANLAPREALLFVGVTDAERTWEDFKKTNGYRAYQDTQLRESVAEWNVMSGAMKKLREKIATALETSPDALKNPFQGPLAFYVTGEPGREEPGMVLVATIGDRALLEQYVSTATKRMRAVASNVETVDAGADQILVFHNKPASPANDNVAEEDELNFDADDELSSPMDDLGNVDKMIDTFFSADSLPEELALCQGRERFYLASTAADIRAALRLSESESMSSHEDRRTMDRLLAPLGPIRMVVNWPRIFELLEAEGRRRGNDDFNVTRKVVGTECMQSFIGHMRIADDGFDGILDGYQLTRGTCSGVMDILRMENRATAPGPQVGAETLLFGSLNLDVSGFLDKVEKILRQQDPAQADMMKASLESAPLPGGEETINLRREFFDHLKPPVTFGIDLRPPYQPDEIRVLLSFGSSNAEAITRTMGKNPLTTQREQRGATVFFSPMIPIETTATSDRFMIGSAPAIDSALSGTPNRPLNETSSFRTVAKAVPEDSWMTVFIETPTLYRALLAYQKHKEALTANPMDVAKGLVAGLIEGFQGELPDDPAMVERLIRYQAPSIFTLSTTTEGIRITLATPAASGS
ncbi:MAG: hypothetical protein AB7N71_14780, partial [Phycisphaerae bacterium]